MINILVWGIGSACEKRLKGLEYDNISIIAFIDSHQDKQGSVFHNRPVLHPNQIHSFAFDYILIASTFEEEIFRQLLAMNIPADKIIPYTISLAEMKRYPHIFTEKQLIISGIEEVTRLHKNSLGELKSSFMNYLDMDGYLSSAEFIKKQFSDDKNNIKKDRLFTDVYHYYDYIIDRAKSNPNWRNELFLEFGVYSGRTINYIAGKLDGKQVHGFDSFLGLPEDWRPGYHVGTFDMEGNLPYVNDNVILHKGWFNETLPEFIKEVGTQKCSLIHIDCDLYSSTKTIFEFLEKNITIGTILMFDELVGYFGWQADEYRALEEFLEATGHEIEYLACVYGGQQVAIQIVS